MAKQNKTPKIIILKRPTNWMFTSGASTRVDEDVDIIQLNGLVYDGELYNTMELTYEG